MKLCFLVSFFLIVGLSPAYSQSDSTPYQIPRADAKVFFEGDYDLLYLTMSDDLIVNLPRKNMSDAWDGILKTYGAYKSHEIIKAQQEDQLKAFYFRTIMEKGIIILKLSYGETGEIEGFDISAEGK